MRTPHSSTSTAPARPRFLGDHRADATSPSHGLPVPARSPHVRPTPPHAPLAPTNSPPHLPIASGHGTCHPAPVQTPPPTLAPSPTRSLAPHCPRLLNFPPTLAARPLPPLAATPTPLCPHAKAHARDRPRVAPCSLGLASARARRGTRRFAGRSPQRSRGCLAITRSQPPHAGQHHVAAMPAPRATPHTRASIPTRGTRHKSPTPYHPPRRWPPANTTYSGMAQSTFPHHRAPPLPLRTHTPTYLRLRGSASSAGTTPAPPTRGSAPAPLQGPAPPPGPRGVPGHRRRTYTSSCVARWGAFRCA